MLGAGDTKKPPTREVSMCGRLSVPFCGLGPVYNFADAKAYFDANRAIHRKFVEMAGNRFLLEMFDMVWGKVMAFPFMLQLRTSILLNLWAITWRS